MTTNFRGQEATHLRTPDEGPQPHGDGAPRGDGLNTERPTLNSMLWGNTPYMGRLSWVGGTLSGLAALLLLLKQQFGIDIPVPTWGARLVVVLGLLVPAASFLRYFVREERRIPAALLGATLLFCTFLAGALTGLHRPPSVVPPASPTPSRSVSNASPAPSVPSRPISKLEQELDRVNIVLSMGTPEDVARVRQWLHNDPAYQVLAEECLTLLKGKRLLNPVSLDVINGKFKEQLGVHGSDTIRPERYRDPEALKVAIFLTWKESHLYGGHGSLEDIVQPGLP